MSFLKIVKIIKKYSPIVAALFDSIEEVLKDDTGLSKKGRITKKEIKTILLDLLPIMVEVLGDKVDNI